MKEMKELKINNRRQLAVAIASLSMLGGYPSMAAAEDSFALEEIVVTARKRQESLMDAPVAVSAVSGEAMKNQGITGMEQLSAKVPGLQIGRAAQTSTIVIRGIGSGINKGFEQSAGMYVDGIYQSRSRQFTQSMVDVQQVEVLRGPQGVLFGKNTVAGAIKVGTANPVVGDEFGGSITAAWEPEQDTQRLTAIASGSLSDKLAARLVVRDSSSDGYLHNELRDEDEQQKDDQLARLTLAWEPTDNLSVIGKVTYLDMEGKGKDVAINAINSDLLATAPAGGFLLLSAPDFQPSVGGNSYDSWTGNTAWSDGDTEDTESTSASLKVVWDLGGYSLTSLTGYTDFEYVQFHDVDFSPINFLNNTDVEYLQMLSQEFRIATDWDGPVNLIAGIYYEEQDFYADTYTHLDGTLGGSVPGGGSLFGTGADNIVRYHNFDQETETLGLFAEVTIDLAEDWTLDIGVRYSEDEKILAKRAEAGIGVPGAAQILVTPEDTAGSPDLAAYLTNAAAVGGVAGATAAGALANLLGVYLADQNLKRTEYHFDPSIKLRWEYSSTGMVFMTYSKGYKSGGYNYSPTTAFASGAPTPDAMFEDESVESWELGVKQELMDGRARFSAIVYQTTLEDLQVTSWNGSNFVVGNAAELDVQGLEMEAQWLLTENLEVGANVNYLDHEYASYPGAPCNVVEIAAQGAGCLNDFSGKRGAFAPEYSGTVYLDYNHSLGNWDLNAHIDVSYKDEMYLNGDLDENSLQDAYTKVDARLGLSSVDGKWNFMLYGRNLTDETTYTASLDAALLTGVYVGWLEEPRILGMQATYNF